jgi:Glycosyltransferase family 87
VLQSDRLSATPATLRRIGGHEQALGWRRELRRGASIRIVHRLAALGDRLRSSAQPWEVVSFLWVPVLGIAYACFYEFRAREALMDFAIFRRAALAVIHGRSPYPHATAAALSHFDKFVYPPVAALLFAPFAALPSEAARVLMFLAGLAAVLGALRLLRVEDWRCYGVAIVSAPVINSLALGALTSFLLLGAALVWRCRDYAAVAALATAFTAVLKLFLWPLAIWLLATRRWRAAALCAAGSAVLLLGGWAVIGFAGLGSYPKLVHLLEQVETPDGYSTIALLGLTGAAATAATVVLSLGAVAAIWIAARSADGDRRAFAVAVQASLVATPLLWLHYLLLLYVPIAVYRPRLSGIWFVPLALWVTPMTHSHGTTWRIAFALGVLAVVALRSVFEGLRLSRAGAVPRPVAS